MKMSLYEAATLVRSVELEGITLTTEGREIAKGILETRKGWTPKHALMLERINRGEIVLPHKLTRLVANTRLALALDLARDMAIDGIRAKKRSARRKAARKRRHEASTAA